MTTLTGKDIGIGYRVGSNGNKVDKKKGDRNRKSKHKMRTHMGMRKEK